ncbi:MAG: fused MFS/spermidine synthase [Nitriliruptorales bacterium]|nr:fused MFS/spermidine synthase [Nitriliruptorales bacterium]
MSRFAASALVFFASASVLVLEILAGRLLAPYVGVTLETFTGIIGTILAGIALGAWLGGRAADRTDPRKLLAPLLIVGGALAFLSIPIVDWLGSGMRGGTPATIVTLAALGFFAPAAVLSAVTPVVVKIRLSSLEETGRVVGMLSAVGTAGALVGTFSTGFILVAAWPTRPVIRALAIALVIVGVALAARTRTWSTGLVVVALVAGAMSFASAHPCEVESAYFCARVIADEDDPTRRTLWLDTLRHSKVDVDDPTHLEFSYAQTLSDVIESLAPPGEPLDVLHIGGGGFSMPRYLRATRPGTHSTVLELDPKLIEIGREHLALTLEDIDVITGDARLNIEDVQLQSMDLVIGDAFGGISVPWHLTTREFVEAIRDVLRPGGTYALNLIDYGDRRFARAELATIADVFEHVAVFAPEGRLGEDPEGGNFIMVASDEPIEVAAILARNASRGDDEAVLVGEELTRFIGDARVLTDDHAPVDQLIQPLP